MARAGGRTAALLSTVAATVVLASCSGYGSGSEGGGEGGADPTPERLDGSASQEFEQSDIDRANEASPEVQAYCAGAASEAQEVGCLSHVDESDIP